MTYSVAPHRFVATLAFLVWMLFASPAALLRGDQGDPLAIRAWPNGVVSIETHWNFEIVVDLGNATQLPQELSTADLLITRPQGQTVELRFQLQPVPSSDTNRGQERAEVSVSEWPVSELSLYLDRVANESMQTLLASHEATFASKNAVVFSHVDERLLLISVDGLRVAIPLMEQFIDPEEMTPVDVLILAPTLHSLPAAAQENTIASAAQLKPRWVVLTDPLIDQPSVHLTESIGNTLAVSHPIAETETETESENASDLQTEWIQLGTSPWQMPAELSELFARKELACRQSQRTFAELSVSQMNFKPSNGTHTPRWNSEHMMGRELLFFTQIFAQRSPAIAAIDLNPKQMPPDYEARHEDWDGGEEARQMERVSSFTRRFAYLLDGLELDTPAPGSAWTLSKLLKQMDKHYTEHTANVVKKQELPDWPKE